MIKQEIKEKIANMLELDIGNYRGNLYIKEKDNKYYWAVECDFEKESEWEWKEITFSLYQELINFNNLKND